MTNAIIPGTQQPQLDTPTFFFMHIAKTAGSFVNYSLAQVFGDAFVEHCEAPPRSPLNLPNADQIVGWSGHIYLRRWLGIERQAGLTTKKFTIIRNPYRQLASHIQWLDHYNLPEHQHEFAALDPDTQGVVRQVGATDITDVGGLDHLLTYLTPRGLQYFDNCQSRYFVTDFQDIAPRDPLHLGMRAQLSAAVESFDYVGRDEKIQDMGTALSGILETDIKFGTERINTSKSLRNVPVDQEDVRAVLKKRLLLDLWLYDQVSGQETPV